MARRLSAAARRSCAGAALVTALILITAATLLGISALRYATTEAGLGATLIAAREAFWLAELGIEAGFDWASAQPAALPRTTARQLPTLVSPDRGRVETAIYPVGSDDHCPAMTAAGVRRDHYEIHATAYAERGARSTHVQGFFICNELCLTAGCIVPEYPAVRSYWQAIAGGAAP